MERDHGTAAPGRMCLQTSRFLQLGHTGNAEAEVMNQLRLRHPHVVPINEVRFSLCGHVWEGDMPPSLAPQTGSPVSLAAVCLLPRICMCARDRLPSGCSSPANRSAAGLPDRRAPGHGA
jgi:hypothetical protein